VLVVVVISAAVVAMKTFKPNEHKRWCVITEVITT
jgi:hypothetical protein